MEPLERIAGYNTVAPGNSARAYTPDVASGGFSAAAPRGNAKASHDGRKTLTLRPSPLVRAMEAAADLTSSSIAEATRQPIEDVRDQLREVTSWLTSGAKEPTSAESIRPPTVPRDYIAAFRKNLLVELDGVTGLDAGEVVHLLLKVDEAGEGWKRTDRGKFISRLTGSDCADAVVAIAHDVRSPLCSILLLVDALRRNEKAQGNSVRDRQLGLIYGAALGLSTTVSNLIDAARGSRLIHGKPAPFSIAETMLAVSAIVEPMAEEKGIPLEIHFPKVDVRRGYAAAIQQALLNLASNALRYTDSGQVTVGASDVSADRVEFSVTDTGPGIPDHVIEQLCYGFPPEGAPLRFSSAGLGLAIVRTLVESMGSTLQVDTGAEGTSFSFVLELPATV
jgi:signal transduction histidine kinase